MSISSRTSILSANFQRLSKVLKKISPLCGDNAHLTKRFPKMCSSRCISSCQQHLKLDQFSQQNTHCRTAFLQNSSLGAPKSFSLLRRYDRYSHHFELKLMCGSSMLASCLHDLSKHNLKQAQESPTET